MTLATLSRYERDWVPSVGERAVVIGGSVAGLCAARVLADGFQTVTVIEKDSIPGGPEPRRGVPQGSQIHALQEAGRATLEDLLPGFGEDVIAAGGLMIDGASDIEFYDEGDFLADGPRRFPVYSASRPLFEHVIRQRVTDFPGVHFRPGCQFVNYRTDDSMTITGVELRNGNADLETVEADLVVDAMGRASPTPRWLDEQGYEPPTVEEVTIDIAYSTIAIERPADGRRSILAPASHPDTRGGAVFPIEGDRWLVNLHGVHGDHPPTTIEGFEDYAASLPVSDIPRLLDTHPRISEDIEYFPFPSNLRRYYERLNNFPAGLLVLGDAIASFNPIYGQGMSVATLEALALHHVLGSGDREDLASRYFDRASEVIDIAWQMAVGADFQFPQTTGPKPRGTDVFGWYLSRLTRKAHTDSELRDALFRVILMEQPPTLLLRPRTVATVLKPSRPKLSGDLWFPSKSSSERRQSAEPPTNAEPSSTETD